MSHQDAVSKIPKNFINIASTFNSKFTAIQHIKKKFMEFNFILRLLIPLMGTELLKTSF